MLPNHFDEEIGLLMDETRGSTVLRFLADPVPSLEETGDICSQLLCAGMERGGAHDHAESLGANLVDHVPEAGPVVVRESPADPDAV